MNYQQLIRDLLTEAKQGIRYKEWDQPKKALAIVAMIPFYLATIAVMVGYYVLLFLYNAVLAPANYLEAWLEDKGGKVHFVTQAVTYLVAMPIIFFLRVIAAIFSFYFFFQWFAMMICTYICTYGGIRWQPFINTATFDKEYNWNLKPSKSASEIFVIILFALFAATVFMFLVQLLIENLELDMDYDDYLDLCTTIVDITNFFLYAYLIDAAIVNVCVLKKQEVEAVAKETVENVDSFDEDSVEEAAVAQDIEEHQILRL